MKSYLAIFTVFALLTSCNSQHSAEKKGHEKDDIRAVGDTLPEMLDKGMMVIFQDKQGNHWFAGGDGGAYKYDGENLVLFREKDGLCSNAILGIQDDQFGNVYFDTPEGVSKFDGRKFTTLPIVDDTLSGNQWTMPSEDLWFRMGWDENGPYHYDGTSLRHMAFPKHGRVDTFYATYPNVSYSPSGIYFIYHDKKGAVWFGTASLGVCRYDGTSLSWLYEEQITLTPGGGDFGIRSILEDKNGHFWFCSSQNWFEILPAVSTVNGTNYLNYLKGEGFGYPMENGEEAFLYFMSMVEDDQGDMWMVNGDGAWHNDGKEIHHYPLKDGETDAWGFVIYKDHQGELWVGTRFAGVFKFNGNAFERFKG